MTSAADQTTTTHDGERTALRTCPLCEATCGLEITLRPDDAGTERVVRIRGDREDVFSKGFICPKGTTLGRLHDDPDRLRTPLVRDASGQLVEATWGDAWREVDARLARFVEQHGREALGIYLGNPNAHNLGSMLYNRHLVRGLGTRAVFSASTVDQRPKEVSSGRMFGAVSIPVPDVDRTDMLVVLGANPLASNGSLATAPDWPGRLRSLVERGGELVVIDPRRTETAREATEWLAIRPGADAHLLAAIAQVLASESLVDLGRLAEHVAGLDEALAAVADLTPEAVAPVTGLDPDVVRSLARRLAAAPAAAVYGRMGTSTQAFGTVASWLVDLVNVLTGNLDRPGGAMFARPAAGSANTRGEPGRGRGLAIHRRHSRVRQLPETLGELPVAVLAEEIDTPGEGQLRGLITVAGNPVLSTPNSERLDAALAGLDLMIAVDIYLNETTRHADVVLPVPSALQKSHYDVALYGLALRNVANWSEPVLPLDPGQPDEWEVLAKLALIAQGAGADADPAVVDDLAWSSMASHAPDDVVAAIDATGRRGPARLLDLMLRTGPYGISLDDLVAAPHGIDLGALEPRIPEVLRTPSGRIELAPEPILEDLARLRATLDRASDPERMLLIGRRDLRSNNSWMHNVEVLVKGKPRCTLHVHPEDARRLGLVDGGEVEVTSAVGKVTIPAEVTDDIRPGVVSAPHGWGHDLPGVRLGVAGGRPGTNSNVLTDDGAVDAVTGNAVLNGIPVELAPAGAPAV
ncbi:molybdopterin-dependent oxidoreductase [Actinomarinicola tropica]|uniref:Molybdopterin-dependent oxidoreductase n=1 Tax=Actinomarinicola tropica TaxID=2789776 RepID=A0A5Q2RH76_9ACTN|nr:molybdopterin-dependent oxidoreductase [Actinomarinicola tropica]QGG96189.1 molybdopterin-dependent oxidoreductase [Actinomarinicola tropica]